MRPQHTKIQSNHVGLTLTVNMQPFHHLSLLLSIQRHGISVLSHASLFGAGFLEMLRGDIHGSSICDPGRLGSALWLFRCWW